MSSLTNSSLTNTDFMLLDSSYCGKLRNIQTFYYLLFVLVFTSILGGCNSNINKWKYQPFSRSVIRLEFVNDPPSTYFISLTEGSLNRFSNLPYLTSLKVDTAGTYFLDFGIDLPGTIATQIDEEEFQIFVFPEDTSTVRIIFMEDGYKMEFGGAAGNINNYLAEKSISNQYLDIVKQCEIFYYRDIAYQDYVIKVDSLTEAEWLFLDSRKSTYDLSRQFIDYEKNRIFYHGLKSKLKKGVRIGTYDRKGRFTRTNEPKHALYHTLLQNPSLNNSKAIYTTSYYDYISTYIRHTWSEDPEYWDHQKIPFTDREIHNITKVDHLLTGRSRYIYLQHILNAMAANRSFQPAFVDSLAGTWRIPIHPQAYESRLNERNRKQNRPSKPGEKLQNFYMSDRNYDMHSIRQFEDKNLVIRLCNQIPDSTSIENMIFEKLADDYIATENFEFINIYMHLEANNWLGDMSVHVSERDFLVEKGWNEVLTRMFGVTKFPYYVIIGKGNTLIESLDHISLTDRQQLDSLLIENKSSI
jgi:hypothetical protein